MCIFVPGYQHVSEETALSGRGGEMDERRGKPFGLLPCCGFLFLLGSDPRSPDRSAVRAVRLSGNTGEWRGVHILIPQGKDATLQSREERNHSEQDGRYAQKCARVQGAWPGGTFT
jgi:hypothetical protein